MNFKKLIITLFIIMGFGNITLAMANIDHFEVILGSDQMSLDNYTDLEIKAMDSNNNVVSDFTGEVLIMSMSDDAVELPSAIEDYSYTFKAEDKGVVKFENGVKFSATGTQDIQVYDSLDTNILGIAEIEVTKSETSTSAEISISTPASGSEINTDNTIVTGNTTKNHSVKVIVNETNNFETTSDNSGLFTVEVKNLQNGNNSIIAQVMDADGKILGESQSISIKSNTDKPVLESFSAMPEVAKEGENINFEIMADAGLKEVSIIFNDEKIKLNEESEGVYKVSKFAPNEGNYDVTIELVNDYAVKTSVLQERAISVKKEESVEEPIKNEEPKEEPVVIENDKVGKVTGVKVTKFKDKSVISWDAQSSALSYNVYKKDESGENILVDNVSENKFVVQISGDEVKYDDFTIKAVGQNEEGIEEESPEFSEMVKVQTGPAEILLILFFSMIIGYMILRRRKA